MTARSLDARHSPAATTRRLDNPGRSPIETRRVADTASAHKSRVNSLKRLRTAAAWDLDSVDGTFLAYGPAVNGERLRGFLDSVAGEAAAGRLFAA